MDGGVGTQSVGIKSGPSDEMEFSNRFAETPVQGGIGQGETGIDILLDNLPSGGEIGPLARTQRPWDRQAILAER